jgi:hypothetical protein
MVFHIEYVKEMLTVIMDRCKVVKPWPLYFISLSKQFYRFSEYMLYASFMMKYHAEHFFYYPYDKYGKTGLRFRETQEIIEQIMSVKPLQEKTCFTYQKIAEYFAELSPSYVQFEHVYYLL